MARRQDKVRTEIGRSPAYPFVPLERALARASDLWRRVGRADVDVHSAKHHWGYGPKSSGGIQTEAALKQFGLLEANGRGDDRRLKLSELAVRLLGDPGIDASERRKLIKQAVLTPRIHRELWDRWGAALPVQDVRRHLIKERNPGFNEKGANDLIDEYRKTISYMELHSSEPAAPQPPRQNPEVSKPEATAGGPPRSPDDERASPARTTPAMKENEINVLFVGNYLRVSALVDRTGLKKLMK